MTANELFHAGDVSTAITQVGREVADSPLDYRKRTFLFELLCFAGDLDRAAKQLDVLGEESPDRSLAAQSYRNLIVGEQRRRLLFSEGRVPGLPNHIPPYTNLHIEAVNRIREGHYDEARRLLEDAESSRPAIGGTLNGERFEDLKDADDVLGPFLEVMVADNYSWLPWETVRSVTIPPPRYVRDLVWAPAHIELNFGPLGDVFLPVLYADSYRHPDARVKLGRMTDWRENVNGLALASGQKLLSDGARDWPILEIRQLEFQHPSEGGADGGNTGTSN